MSDERIASAEFDVRGDSDLVTLPIEDAITAAFDEAEELLKRRLQEHGLTVYAEFA